MHYDRDGEKRHEEGVKGFIRIFVQVRTSVPTCWRPLLFLFAKRMFIVFPEIANRVFRWRWSGKKKCQKNPKKKMKYAQKIKIRKIPRKNPHS